jgi:hypothetical protein
METFGILKPGDIVKHLTYGEYVFVAKHKERFVFSGVFITQDNLAHKFVHTGATAYEVYLATKTQKFLQDATVTLANINDVRKNDVVLLQSGSSDFFWIAGVRYIDLTEGVVSLYGNTDIKVGERTIIFTGFRR